MKQVEIVDFQEHDYDELVGLWEITGLGGSHRGDDLAVIRTTLRMGGVLLLAKEREEGRIIGSSWMTVDGRRTYIHHFGIHPEYQGKGWAKELLKASMERAVKIGCQVKLEVHRDNVKALNLYKQHGFKYLGDYLVYIMRNPETFSK